MRIACGIAYQGHQYHGWQRQTASLLLRTIQGEIERALSLIANEPIVVHCAGRTDAGVHATYQVIHFDTVIQRSESAWVFGTNHFLPPDIRVLWIQPIAATFHARHSAMARRYRYFIDNQRVHQPFFHSRTTWIPQPLQHAAMHLAAQYLLGYHDFSAFRDSDCQSKTAHRHISAISVSSQQGLIVIDVEANAFLHHMVRNITGVLMEIGRGRKPVEWIQTVLASCDRKQAATTAVACGLYLVDVLYPEQYVLPAASATVVNPL